MILACQKIEKAFGGKSVLNNVNFLINEGEKAAVIGIEASEEHRDLIFKCLPRGSFRARKFRFGTLDRNVVELERLNLKVGDP